MKALVSNDDFRKLYPNLHYDIILNKRFDALHPNQGQPSNRSDRSTGQSDLAMYKETANTF